MASLTKLTNLITGKLQYIPRKSVVNHNYRETKQTTWIESTSCNLQTRPFEPAEQSMCFLRGSLEWMTEAKNINDSYNFDLRSHVSEKQGNRSKENAGR